MEVGCLSTFVLSNSVFIVLFECLESRVTQHLIDVRREEDGALVPRGFGGTTFGTTRRARRFSGDERTHWRWLFEIGGVDPLEVISRHVYTNIESTRVRMVNRLCEQEGLSVEIMMICSSRSRRDLTLLTFVIPNTSRVR